MSAKMVFEIRPKGIVAKELLTQHGEALGGNRGSKTRRLRFTLASPASHNLLEIVLTLPGKQSGTQDVSYRVTLRPACLLVGQFALVENMALKPAGCLLVLFRNWLKDVLPRVTDKTLTGITADDCQMLEITGTYYFAYQSEGAAFQALCKLYQHSLACLNNSDPYPGANSQTKALASRLHTVNNDANALTIDLMHLPAQEQFGHLRAYLMRDPSTQPKTFASLAPLQRQSLRASAHCLLCFDVTVDVGKSLHYGDDKNFKLPSDYRHWSTEYIPVDPFLMIWEATRYAIWLNLPMPKEARDIDFKKLNAGDHEVLQDYLEGQNLRHNQRIVSTEELLNFRRRLLQSVSIDIFMPWAIAKLNHCEELGEQLTYENRFRPGENPAFKMHCLSSGNADDQVAALLQRLPSCANGLELLAVSKWGRSKQ